jgi:hypothetical protein
MMIRRMLIGALAALMATVGGLAISSPAQAIPTTCSNLGYDNGRDGVTDNDANGGGAFVDAILCWSARGNGYYDTYVQWTVYDTSSNSAGATPRLEWTGTDGVLHTFTPPSSQRAWANGEYTNGVKHTNNIKGLYVRACLTNADNPSHHCGPRA